MRDSIRITNPITQCPPASPILICVVVVAGVLGAASSAFALGFDRENRPSNILTGSFIERLQDLPTQGQVPAGRIPYSDTYWPLNRGSIAYRWNASDPRFHWTSPRVRADDYIFGVEGPSRQMALLMQPWQIAELSPAEKYDLYLGRYDYPLTRRVREESGRSYPYWRGICHGWSAAALNHREPGHVTVRNADGIEIQFNSGDLKGLLNYYYAKNASPDAPIRRIGTRCRGGLFGGGSACQDVNPGAFHVAMTNLLGTQHQGFIAELDPGDEIWNYPIFAYRTQVLGNLPLPAETCSTNFFTRRTENCRAENSYRRVLVRTTLQFADDDERFGPSATPVVGTANFRQRAETFEYELDLDLSERIVGGEWRSARHPDFIWVKERMEFAGEFRPLGDLIEASYQER